MTNYDILRKIYGKVDYDTFMGIIKEIESEEYGKEILEYDSEDVARQLRLYAVENGVKASEIARDLGIDRSSVTRWLKGDNLPKRKAVIQKVKKYLYDKHEKLVIEASE